LNGDWQTQIGKWQEEFLANITQPEKGSKYFADWIFETIPSIIGPVEQDIVVTTTLISEMQRYEEESCKKF
jgi:hypothetical protein